MTTITRRGALASAAALTLIVATPASAHAPVTHRYPTPGAAVTHVKTAKITFGEAVVTGRISVSRGGTAVTPTVAGLDKPRTHLRATFSRTLPSGRYEVSWRALADDGHRETGRWSFTVK